MSGPALLSPRSALGVLLALALAAPLLIAAGDAPPRSEPAAPPAVRADPARLPLAFEPAAGRFGDDVSYVTRRGSFALGLMRDGSTVVSAAGSRVRTRLLGAREGAHVRAESKLPGTVNSYVGRDRSKWRAGLPTYGAVRYEDVYPGVDLLYHGRGGELEYDYVLQPGVDPERIRMAITGGGLPRLTAAGDLLVRTNGGPLRQRRPVAYQDIDGRRVPVTASFDVDGRRVGFEVGAYDEDRPLVIDPQLVFTSYFGGPQNDTGEAVAVSQTGGTFLLVGGATRSNEFHGSNPNATSNLVTNDAWLSKLTADGSTVLWTTFMGGTANDSLAAIAPGTGGIMVTGATASSDFPVNVSLGTPYDSVLDGADGGWIGRVDSASGSLDVATFAAGSPMDVAYRYPRVYIAGNTGSASGVATSGAADETLGGSSDGFVAAYSANLGARHWGTYVGGTAIENLFGLTIDQENPPSVYTTGWTQSDDFPVTAGSGNADNIDAFLVKLPRIDGATVNDPDLPADGSAFGYSRLVAGAGVQFGSVDAGLDVWANSGTAVIVGYSDATTLTGTSAVDPGPGFDGFAISVSHTSGTTVFGGAFMGGNGANGGSNEAATAVTADAFGGPVYIAGVTNSTNLGTVNPVQSQNAGGDDAFVARYASNLGSPTPTYMSYLGGTGNETANDIALDTLTDSAYVAGTTGSTNFGATATYGSTPDPVQPENAGGGDAFIAQLQPPPAVITGGPAEGSTITSSTADFTLGPTAAPNSSFQCKLDNGGFATCSSTPSFSGLSDGPHTLTVKHFEGGDTNGSVAVRHWTVDTTSPPALLEPGDGAEIASSQPALSWTASGGVTRYDVELDGRELGLSLDPSTGTYTPAALSEGAHEWRVVAVDQFGTKTFSSRRGFRVDLTPPNAQLSASPNPMLAGRTVTVDASASSDPAGGRIAKYEWDLDGDGTFETDGGTTSTITRSFTASGAYLLAVRLTDPVGRTATAATTLIVTTPPVPPGQLGVTVNSGAQYTRSADVKLNLVFPTTTTQFLVSNDGGFLAPATFAPQREIDWKLDSSGPERLPKTVYVRFLLNGIVSETYTDDIILDETPPVVQQATVVPAAGGARAAALRNWTVRLRATDSNSGVDAVQITPRKSRPGRFLRYRRQLRVRAATKKLYVRARDRAGNLSRWRTAR